MATVSKDNKVHFYVSPFQRTLQTASWVANIFNILTHVFFPETILEATHFWLRGAKHHFFEFRSITSGACLGRSTDSRTRIWQFARPGGLRIGGVIFKHGYPIFTEDFTCLTGFFVAFWAMISYNKHENSRWIQSLWKY